MSALLALAACKPSKHPADTPYDRPVRTAVAQPGQAEADAPPEPLSDDAIADAIERELLMDRSVSTDSVEVVSRKGMVELSGTVDNLLARDRATRLAEVVKGVRGVQNRITVVPATPRDDQALRQDIETALVADPALATHSIGVTVEKGVATLTGSVDSWAARELAAYVAKGVKGVVELRSRVDVAPAIGRSDHEIENEIAQRLRWDALVHAGAIDIAVENGKVRLGGSVGSAAERTRAFEDAWVAGVSAVDHADLQVKWWTRDAAPGSEIYVVKSDEAIEQAIRDAARHDPRVRTVRLEPESTAGMVLLRGTVDNLKARQAAEQLARTTMGVVAVKNYIKVSMKQPLESAALADAVHRALARNPITERYEVQLAADQGVVTLRGAVDHYFEKVEAQNVAESVRGVVEVDNQLDVRNTLHAFVYDPYLYPYYPQPSDAWSHYIPTTQVHADAQIRQAIETELSWSPHVDPEAITVSVISGRATLTGTVESWRERQAATDNAFEGGAIAVINRLGVTEK
jgi:osmotically-inducible protein OsmY